MIRSKLFSIKDFIENIQISRPDISKNILRELHNFIVLSGCTVIDFEIMSNRAMGISKTDRCVINTKVLQLPIEYLLYIILHEVAHQYQYNKHGKDLVLDVYIGNLTLKSAASKLLMIERIADRLAIKKLNSILNTNNVPQRVVPRYLNVTGTEPMQKYLIEIRAGINVHKFKTIEEINNYIYDLIK